MELNNEAKLGMILGGLYLLGVVVGSMAMKAHMSTKSDTSSYLEGYSDALNTIAKICKPEPKDI